MKRLSIDIPDFTRRTLKDVALREMYFNHQRNFTNSARTHLSHTQQLLALYKQKQKRVVEIKVPQRRETTQKEKRKKKSKIPRWQLEEQTNVFQKKLNVVQFLRNRFQTEKFQRILKNY